MLDFKKQEFEDFVVVLNLRVPFLIPLAVRLLRTKFTLKLVGVSTLFVRDPAIDTGSIQVHYKPMVFKISSLYQKIYSLYIVFSSP